MFFFVLFLFFSAFFFAGLFFLARSLAHFRFPLSLSPPRIRKPYSRAQARIAFRCAVVLRDLINPYLLRRRKADVAAGLPPKTEHVLFCRLTPEQRGAYRAYLASPDVAEMLAASGGGGGQRRRRGGRHGDDDDEGRGRNPLAGIDVLRKICNHPDLLQRSSWGDSPGYGDPSRSGKLRVALRVLSAWAGAGHKALVFCQTQQMLDILQSACEKISSSSSSASAPPVPFRAARLDGGTPIARRAAIVDAFNAPSSPLAALLLTTRVGGLGLNLTGADRVLLFDADWNPATDAQARERAWRLGQTRPVAVYRLLAAGTIEEKVYHRQLLKQFVADRVLRDPRARRLFKASDLADLFTLADDDDDGQGGGGNGGGGNGSGGVLSAGARGTAETARLLAAVPGAAVIPEDLRERRNGGGRGRGRGRGRSGSSDKIESDDDDAATATAAAEAGATAAAVVIPAVAVAEAEAGAGAGGGEAQQPAGDAGLLASLFDDDGGDGGGNDGDNTPPTTAAEAAPRPRPPPPSSTSSFRSNTGLHHRNLRTRRNQLSSSIVGALDHGAVEDAGGAAASRLEAAAARAAARAAAALARSHREVRGAAGQGGAAVNVPTWTGRSGAGGAPLLLPPARGSGRPRFGGGGGRAGSSLASGGAPAAAAAAPPPLASADLLARLRARVGGGSSDPSAPAPRAAAAAAPPQTSSAVDARAAALSEAVVGFLASAGPSTSVAVVSAVAAGGVLSPEEAPLFRAVLRGVARLRTSEDAVKRWELRPAFAALAAEGGVGGVVLVE